MKVGHLVEPHQTTRLIQINNRRHPHQSRSRGKKEKRSQLSAGHFSSIYRRNRFISLQANSCCARTAKVRPLRKVTGLPTPHWQIGKRQLPRMPPFLRFCRAHFQLSRSSHESLSRRFVASTTRSRISSLFFHGLQPTSGCWSLPPRRRQPPPEPPPTPSAVMVVVVGHHPVTGSEGPGDTEAPPPVPLQEPKAVRMNTQICARGWLLLLRTPA